ncbi:MAG: Ig-like domain-containing protein [Bacteroidota bacterium]|nr:Ig-like domain-containing protein [Bacteroidota bacterium]
MNTRNIIASITLVMVVLFAGCKKDTYKEIEGFCPKVISTDPTNGSVSVPLNKVITITFNGEMNPLTMNSNTITISDSAAISGVVTYSGVTATFTPTNPLKDNTTYTGVVKTSAKDPIGNALQENYIWTFSTGTTITPMVASTDPYDTEVEVALNKTITATFNMPMDFTTLNNSTFTINDGISNIAGSFSDTGNTVFFNPSLDLKPKTLYTGTITTGAKNLAGVAILSNYTWKFTTDSIRPPTVILTNPLNLATNVQLDITITANFSTGMLPSSIDEFSFLLTDSLFVPIVGAVSYSGTTATFNPDVDLLPNKKYIATIKNTVKNLAGINMVNDYVWSFKTPGAVPPTVTSTDPYDTEINVKVNKTLSATFSQLMNGTTINNLTFLLEEGVNPIAGAVNYSGFTATFNPDVDLKPNTLYKATIKTSAKNLSGLGLVQDKIWTFTTTGPSGPLGVDLDCVEDYAVIAGSAVTNTGASIVDGDLGLSPGSSVSGFPPGTIVNGSIRINDTKTNDAKLCLTAAYNDAAGRTLDVIVVSDGQLGGKTFAPGLYQSAPGSFEITGSDFILDAKGNVDAVWIFQMPSSTLTVGNGIKVTLINGAQAKNIYWQVGTSATIGTTAEMKGNILADQSITLQTGATLIGRALTRIAAVTLDDNAVTKP